MSPRTIAQIYITLLTRQAKVVDQIAYTNGMFKILTRNPEWNTQQDRAFYLGDPEYDKGYTALIPKKGVKWTNNC